MNDMGRRYLFRNTENAGGLDDIVEAPIDVYLFLT